MDYKKLHHLIHVSLLFAVGTSLAMDQAIVCRKYHETTFKSLEGFPCLNLHGVNESWHKMPQDKQKKVQKKIINYCDEKFLTLFNLATKLPEDLQMLIATQVYNADPEAIRRFFNDPMADIINDYVWAHKYFLVKMIIWTIGMDLRKYVNKVPSGNLKLFLDIQERSLL